jgi:hypothetical protein
MFKHRSVLTMVCWGILNLAGLFSLSFAQGDFSICLSEQVVADPGQAGVPLYLVLTSVDSIAGIDMLLEFDPELLTCSAAKLLSRFQYVSYDTSAPERVRIIGRRHHPDSTYLTSLPPGTDTLGLIWMNVTSQDLLVDIEAPVSFLEDPATPFADNKLVKSDSSFITSPELMLIHGSVLIRHPLYGDVNDDGYAYTIADAIYFFNFLAGIKKFSFRQRANSDVNRDGMQASMADFLELIKVILEE